MSNMLVKIHGMRSDDGDLIPITITDSGYTSAMVQCVCGDVFSASGDSADVRRQSDVWRAEHANCEKQPYETKTFWLSFCDVTLPKGQQFLGACIVDVTPADVELARLETLLRFPLAEPGAEYIAAAIINAHALGCNPGGEVASHEIPTDHPNLALYTKGVLMDRATCEAIDQAVRSLSRRRVR